MTDTTREYQLEYEPRTEPAETKTYQLEYADKQPAKPKCRIVKKGSVRVVERDAVSYTHLRAHET